MTATSGCSACESRTASTSATGLPRRCSPGSGLRWAISRATTPSTTRSSSSRGGCTTPLNPFMLETPEVNVNQITWQVGSMREVFDGGDFFRRHGLRIQRSGRDLPGSNWNVYPFDPEGHVNELFYGIEQCGWNGRSKPLAMHGNRVREPPPLPHISETDGGRPGEGARHRSRIGLAVRRARRRDIRRRWRAARTAVQGGAGGPGPAVRTRYGADARVLYPQHGSRRDRGGRVAGASLRLPAGEHRASLACALSDRAPRRARPEPGEHALLVRFPARRLPAAQGRSRLPAPGVRRRSATSRRSSFRASTTRRSSSIPTATPCSSTTTSSRSAGTDARAPPPLGRASTTNGGRRRCPAVSDTYLGEAYLGPWN